MALSGGAALNQSLAAGDPAIAALIGKELNRQQTHLELIASENFTSRAQGFVRLDDQSVPDGLKVRVATPSLARLTGTTLGGAAAYIGTWSGDADAWKIIESNTNA